MAFKKFGSPEKIEIISTDTVDTVICKCGILLISSSNGSKIKFSSKDAMITCMCGEVTHVI